MKVHTWQMACYAHPQHTHDNDGVMWHMKKTITLNESKVHLSLNKHKNHAKLFCIHAHQGHNSAIIFSSTPKYASEYEVSTKGLDKVSNCHWLLEYYFTIVAFGLPINLDYLYIMLQSLNTIHFYFTQSFRAHHLLQIWISIPMITALLSVSSGP